MPRMQAAARGISRTSERRPRAVGYFGVVLGLAELVFPEQVAALVGLKARPATRRALRLLGAGKLLGGLVILAKAESAGPLRGPLHVVRSITINRHPDQVYAFWRELENLPRFMAHLESVTDEGETSVWRAKAPAGTSVEWRAEITEEQRGERIAWRSLERATVPNRGAVCFKPGAGGRGTLVIVELKYEPPGGALTGLLGQLFGKEPGQQIADDLRRLKQVLETGSVVHSDSSIHHGPHPARPPAADEPITLLGSEAT